MIPTVLGLLVLSNMMTGTFTGTGIPLSITWTGVPPPDGTSLVYNNWYPYALAITNPSATIAWTGVSIEVNMTAPAGSAGGPNDVHMQVETSSGTWTDVGVIYQTTNNWCFRYAVDGTGNVPTAYQNTQNVRFLIAGSFPTGQWSYSVRLVQV